MKISLIAPVNVEKSVTKWVAVLAMDGKHMKIAMDSVTTFDGGIGRMV